MLYAERDPFNSHDRSNSSSSPPWLLAVDRSTGAKQWSARATGDALVPRQRRRLTIQEVGGFCICSPVGLKIV